MHPRQHRGFTLIEMLVVIAIMGILIAIMWPAIAETREAARLASCSNNLTQLGIALRSYQAAHEVLPPGVVEPQGPIRTRPQGYHMSWVVQLLPYIEEGVAYKAIDFSVGVYDPKNAPVREMVIPMLECPSYGGDRHSIVGIVSNYAGCHHDVEAPIDADNHGVFFLNSHIREKDVSDGRTHTIYLGEKLGGQGDLGWMSGTRATLRNTGSPPGTSGEDNGAGWTESLSQGWEWEERECDDGDGKKPLPETFPNNPAQLQVGGFSSNHTTVVNFLFGDGAVRHISDEIDPAVFQQLGDRADGKLLTSGPTRSEY